MGVNHAAAILAIDNLQVLVFKRTRRAQDSSKAGCMRLIVKNQIPEYIEARRCWQTWLYACCSSAPTLKRVEDGNNAISPLH